MKEIFEKKINITQIAPPENGVEAEKIFIAGNAKKDKDTLCGCQKTSEEAVNELNACTEGCNCLIPFCSVMNVPEGFGNVSDQPSDRKIYYVSNLYYVVDTNPCVINVSPPRGCIDLPVDIYAIRIVGNISYNINIKLLSDGVAAASDTGSEDNFTVPSRSCCSYISSNKNVAVNQVAGYVTSLDKSPVENGEYIPSGQIQVAFLVKTLECSSLQPANDGKCLNCNGNFKITKCPLTNVEE